MQNESYEDTYLVRRLNDIIAMQKRGEIVVANYQDGTGLPTLDMLGKHQNAQYPHDYIVGDNLGYLDMRQGLYIFTPIPGKKLPKVLENYKVIQLAEAKIEATTRTATIQVGDTLITFTGMEPWKHLSGQLREINEELARINAGVVIWKVELIPDQSGIHHLFPKGIPSVMNGQTRLDVTGYAIDNQNNLVYLGVVGYKTCIESLRATLLQKKLVTLDDPQAFNNAYLHPLGKYEQVWQAMPEYTSHHSVFVSHQALPGKWDAEDTALYLLSFHGVEDIQSELKQQFAVRLNEALEIPILPEWADALWEAGYKNQYIRKLDTGGDCLAGVLVNLQADWSELLEQMLKHERLTI
jgi:hypothetical protein